MASELHSWRFKLDFFQVGYPVATTVLAILQQLPSDIVRL